MAEHEHYFLRANGGICSEFQVMIILIAQRPVKCFEHDGNETFCFAVLH